MSQLTTLPAVDRVRDLPIVQDREKIELWLSRNTPQLDNPEVFASHGDEMNTVRREWDECSVKICIVGAMSYRNSVGNLAVPLLYSEIHDKGPEDWLVDRAYLWETRRNFEMFTKGYIPIIGLQTHRSLAEFDILLFTCSYLQTILHVPLMLNRSGIPYKFEHRTDSDPLILIGGHHMYVNPEPIWQIPDAIFVGEFSAGGMDMINDYLEFRDKGQTKYQWIVDYVSRRPKGFYVPHLYEETYSKHEPYQIATKGPLLEGVLYPVPKAYCTDLDDEAHISDRPIVSFINASMGTAEVQSSFGCDHSTCTFCSEGQTNKPYRFFSVDRIVEKAKEQMKWTGMRAFTVSAFDGAGHPQKRHMIRRLLEEVSDEVGLLSLRVNEMADDEIFSVISTTAGNSTLSLGVEGMSERMRHVFQKNCSEEAILKVCEQAMIGGARKLKFFMIANHPWETEEDRMEWVSTLEKIVALKEKTGSKAQILTSWTPLFLMPHTALQWEKPTVDHRTLHKIIDGIKTTGTDFRIGSGGRMSEAYMSQLLQLGDRRLSHLVDWCVDNGFIHYGSTPRNYIQRIEEEVLGTLPDQPMTWEDWFRARSYDEILPWDILKVGPDKEWLILLNEVSKRGGAEIPGCNLGCTACGACSKLDRAKMDSGFLLKDEEFELHDINVIRQRGRVQVLRLKFMVDKEHRYVEDEYWLAGAVRAFRIAGLPVDKSYVSIVSQRFNFFDYSYGVDYMDLGVIDRVEPREIQEIIEPHLPSGFHLLDVRGYSPRAGLLKRLAGSVHFVTDVRPLFSLGRTKAAVERMLGADEYIIKVLKKDFRSGVKGFETDIRPWVEDAWIQTNGILHMLLTGTANPYELLPGMFGVFRRRLLQLDTVRAEIYLPHKDSDQVDAFRPFCPVYGTQLRANLYDEVDPSGLSAKAKFNRIKLDFESVGRVEVDIESDEELAEQGDFEKAKNLFEELIEEEMALVKKTFMPNA